MDIEPTTKTPIEPDQPNSQDDDIDIPDLVDIVSWVSNYFKFSSNDIDIKMIKMALKKIQKTFEDQNVPTKPSSECQKLAIKYVQHLKEGCILLYSRFSIIVISFKNCRIHTKSSAIFEFLEQSVKNRNMSRFWKFIKQTLEIDENFVCLDSQNSYLFEHALSSVCHDFHFIKQIDEYDTRFKYGNRKRYTRVRIYIWFRSLLCNVFRSMLGTVLSLIHTNCFRMNSNEYLSFVENLNFVKNIPYTYLNDPIVPYSGLAGVIHNHKMNLPSEYVFKKRKCYCLYVCLQNFYHSGSELSFQSFLERYISFCRRDIKTYYSAFMTRFNCSPLTSDEIFLSTLVSHSESHWDSSDFLDFIRDVISFGFSFDTALKKLKMKTNPSLILMCNTNLEKFQMVRQHIKNNLFSGWMDVLLDHDISPEKLEKVLKIRGYAT